MVDLNIEGKEQERQDGGSRDTDRATSWLPVLGTFTQFPVFCVGTVNVTVTVYISDRREIELLFTDTSDHSDIH